MLEKMFLVLLILGVIIIFNTITALMLSLSISAYGQIPYLHSSPSAASLLLPSPSPPPHLSNQEQQQQQQLLPPLQQQSSSALKKSFEGKNNQGDIAFNRLNTNDGKVVILTFGDGYKSHYIYAKPVLDKYGFKANFFVTCNRIGTIKNEMTWPEVVQLYKEGNVIGSKTMDYGINITQEKDLNHLSAKDLEYEVGQSKQCLLDHGITNTTIFAVPKNIATNNATVINTIAKYYDFAINGNANLMYLHCDGYKKYSSQTDCRTYYDNGTLTFANRYSIKEWSMHHSGHGNSYNNLQMFEKFVAELNSQNKYNNNNNNNNNNNKEGGIVINAIPIIGYHDIIPLYSDVSYTNQSSDTTLNLFEVEMKYLHDNGYRVITFSDLGYDKNSNSFFIIH
jgi:peptidoglycan/xylan/chitin deacetylase (PgdA/CDA1 family)